MHFSSACRQVGVEPDGEERTYYIDATRGDYKKNVNQWCIDWTYWTIGKKDDLSIIHATAGRWKAKIKKRDGTRDAGTTKVMKFLEIGPATDAWFTFYNTSMSLYNKRWARFIKAGHPKPWIPCGFSPRTGGMHKIIKSILWGRKKRMKRRQHRMQSV